MITLFDYWRSSAAYRVRIALNLLGLAYTSVPVDLVKGEQSRPENLARNPQGLVPTLEIDGLSLTQSLAILEYLDEVHGGGFLPKDPAGRAQTRALAYAIAMETSPVCNLSVRNYVAQNSNGAITAESWQTHFIIKGLTAFEAMLDHPTSGRFCHGDSITMPDICLVPQAYNAHRLGLDLAVFPRLSAILAALESTPAVKAAHPDNHQPKG
jgi:maleylacetoacetate isomerase